MQFCQIIHGTGKNLNIHPTNSLFQCNCQGQSILYTSFLEINHLGVQTKHYIFTESAVLIKKKKNPGHLLILSFAHIWSWYHLKLLIPSVYREKKVKEGKEKRRGKGQESAPRETHACLGHRKQEVVPWTMVTLWEQD